VVTTSIALPNCIIITGDRVEGEHASPAEAMAAVDAARAAATAR
jgi:hypothetical protein